jgi:hypothetical protein
MLKIKSSPFAAPQIKMMQFLAALKKYVEKVKNRLSLLVTSYVGHGYTTKVTCLHGLATSNISQTEVRPVPVPIENCFDAGTGHFAYRRVNFVIWWLKQKKC